LGPSQNQAKRYKMRTRKKKTRQVLGGGMEPQAAFWSMFNEDES